MRSILWLVGEVRAGKLARTSVSTRSYRETE